MRGVERNSVEKVFWYVDILEKLRNLNAIILVTETKISLYQFNTY